MYERESLELEFDTSLDDTRIVRIANPRQDLEQPGLIEQVGDFIMQANPFDETIGSLTNFKRAILSSTTHKVLLPR